MDTALRSRNRRTLVGLAALFFLPLAASFALYYGGWRPEGNANHGELINPARPLPTISLPSQETGGANTTATPLFGEHWTLLYIGNGRCDTACRHALYVMRQTRLALHKEMTRVQRVFLATQDCCNREFLQREHPGLRTFDGASPQATTLLREFPGDNREHMLFIVDPLGNLVMRFDARQNPKGLLTDLKKLLRLSHIG